VQFGAPIASFQGIQFKLADMATKIAASRSLTHRAARLRDADMTVDMASSQAKLYATRACVEVVDDAFQIFGGYGFMLEYPIARRYADAKIMEIGEGTNEIQRIVIARGLGCPSGR
jgi:alkylation response protein AidB-like acyl-CoA dehydrogenase